MWDRPLPHSYAVDCTPGDLVAGSHASTSLFTHRSAPSNTARRRELRYANLPINLRPTRPLRGGSPATSVGWAGLADIKVCNICCAEDVRVFILHFASRSRYRISSRWIEQALPISRALIKLAEDHLMPVDPGCSPPRCLNPRSPRASALIHHAPARGSGNGHAAGASGRAHHDLVHADPSKRRTRSCSPFLDGSTRRSLQNRAHPTGPIIYGLRQTHSCSNS